MTSSTPAAAEAMIAARRRDSHERRTRVTQAIEVMLANGTPITFTAVARQAGVSAWLVHAHGVREAIERHGGEARYSRDNFKALRERDKNALLKFLETI